MSNTVYDTIGDPVASVSTPLPYLSLYRSARPVAVLGRRVTKLMTGLATEHAMAAVDWLRLHVFDALNDHATSPNKLCNYFLFFSNTALEKYHILYFC